MDERKSDDLIERLQRESRLVRAIARAVLHDEHLADDVVQDAYKKALEKRHEGPVVLTWIARVARNLSLDTRRRETRRARREALVAKPEAQAAQSERSFRAVTLAVLALEEPYRRTIIARFFDGLAPSAIAARDDVPLATVKSRLHRGLSQLRAALLHEFGDDEDSMLRGLALLAAPKGLFEVLVSGGIAMSTVGKSALAAAALTVGMLLVWNFNRSSIEPTLAARAEPKTPLAPAFAADPTPALPTQGAARESVADEPARTGIAANELDATIEGRIELPGGSPAIGAIARINGFVANNERAHRFGEPRAWKDLEATTDSTGRFVLRFDPPRAYGFSLRVEAVGEATPSWYWDAIPPHANIDVGVVRLPATGSIEGRIVAADGKPRPNPSRLEASADSWYQPASANGKSSSSVVVANRETGEFRIAAVPVGTTKLRAYWIGGGDYETIRSDEIEVEVEPGRTIHQDLVLAPPPPPRDDGRRIRVFVTNDLLHLFARPAEGSLVRLGMQSEPVAATMPGGGVAYPESEWAFESVPAGEYTIALRDPDFEPWSKSCVKPGESIRLAMVGAAGVKLVVKQRDGLAIDDYLLHGRVESASFHSSEFWLRSKGASVPDGAIYRGLVANSYALSVEASGFAPTSVIVPDLRAGEIRTVEVTVDPGAKLHGRVFAGNRRCAGATVCLIDPNASLAIVSRNGKDPTCTETTSDEDGNFEFEPIRPGNYVVEATLNHEVRSARQPIVITVDRTEIAADLRLPGTGKLIGTLEAREGAPLRLPGLKLAAASRSKAALERRALEKSGPRDPFQFAVNDVVEAMADESGRFVLDELPEGECEFWLRLPGAILNQSWNGTTSSQPVDPMLLDVVTIEADRTVEHTFRLGEDVPGNLVLDVTIDGVPAANAFVSLLKDPNANGVAWPLGGSLLDAAGHGRIGPIRSTSGRLFVRARSDTLFASASDRASVVAGRESSLRLDLTTSEAEIVLLDSKDGKPLEPRTAWRAGIQIGGFTSFLPVDAAGAVRFRLSPGTYRVVAANGELMPNDQRAAVFTWPPASGHRLELRLE